MTLEEFDNLEKGSIVLYGGEYFTVLARRRDFISEYVVLAKDGMWRFNLYKGNKMVAKATSINTPLIRELFK